MKKKHIALFIPTLNAGQGWPRLLSSIKSQSLALDKTLVIDSGSSDKTISHAIESGDIEILSIDRTQFNHGGTRNQAIVHLKDFEFLIFLTQDVILADDRALENLILPFQDPVVACVYGRQLPHEDANPLAIHAREYNYPAMSMIKDAGMIEKIGFKVSHISNAFCAYRTSYVLECGMFPTDVIIAEDTYLASRLIKNGYKIFYQASALAYHSHNYSALEEFRRYFDTGVFHAQNSWIKNDFGGPNGEGKRYVLSELKFIVNKYPLWILSAVVSNAMKFIGFKLGENYSKLPKFLLRPFSMHKNYWRK